MSPPAADLTARYLPMGNSTWFWSQIGVPDTLQLQGWKHEPQIPLSRAAAAQLGLCFQTTARR
jgi:hypothetical protein